jgi:hypothetical protein
LDDALGGNGKPVIDEVFTADQVKLLKEFRSAVKRTITPREPSGTSYSIQRMFQSYAPRFMALMGFKIAGPGGAAAGMAAGKAATGLGTGGVGKAIKGTPRPRPSAVPLTATGSALPPSPLDDYYGG